MSTFLLLRAKETATEYLPFEALVRQYEELFGEKLELGIGYRVDVGEHRIFYTVDDHERLVIIPPLDGSSKMGCR